MPRVCTVCSHKDRPAIDRRLIDGATNAGIAREYGLNEEPVRQHRLKHLSKAVEKAAERREEARGESLLNHLEALIQRASSIVDAALSDRKHTAAVSGLRTIGDLLRTIGELTGQLGHGGTTVNVAVFQANQQQRLMLDRLNVHELRELRRLVAKAEGSDVVVEVEAKQLDESITAPQTPSPR
jgi:hypothetical protein